MNVMATVYTYNIIIMYLEIPLLIIIIDNANWSCYIVITSWSCYIVITNWSCYIVITNWSCYIVITNWSCYIVITPSPPPSPFRSHHAKLYI